MLCGIVLKLKSLGFPAATTEDDRKVYWWLLVNTGHITEARKHYDKPVELESRSARIQSTISKHTTSPSPYHNRPSASARPSAQPSGIIEKNYLNDENWRPIDNNYKYRFVDPENGYTEDVSVERYIKIMGILPPIPKTGGSRKRSRRHSKKQKRVRHTRRKQTRRHRHRHSRHSRHRR